MAAGIGDSYLVKHVFQGFQEYFPVVHIGYKQGIRLIGKAFQGQKVANFSGYAKPAIIAAKGNQLVGQILHPYGTQGNTGFIFKYAPVKNSLCMRGYQAKAKAKK